MCGNTLFSILLLPDQYIFSGAFAEIQILHVKSRPSSTSYHPHAAYSHIHLRAHVSHRLEAMYFSRPLYAVVEDVIERDTAVVYHLRPRRRRQTAASA